MINRDQQTSRKGRGLEKESDVDLRWKEKLTRNTQFTQFTQCSTGEHARTIEEQPQSLDIKTVKHLGLVRYRE